MVEVPLIHGKVALIDDEDAPRILAHKWTLHYNKSRRRDVFYAVRYIRKGDKRASIQMHREILNAPAGMEVDHINGNGLDNRKNNLRLATRTQNQCNRSAPRNNTSGYKGVRRNRGKWEARIKVAKKQISLGVFTTPQDAARAYDTAATLLHGEFARFNFPDESETLRGVLRRIQSKA